MSLELVKKASFELKNSDESKKNEVLTYIAQLLEENIQEIIKANEIDLKSDALLNTPSYFLDRLKLDENRIKSMIEGVRQIIDLKDPINEVIEERALYNNLKLQKVRVPFGVIAIIFEARPNVTVDCAALCIKTGNACVLKGGKEAINTNKILVKYIKMALKQAGLNEENVHLIESSDREETLKLMQATKYVDLLIPRGSSKLIQYCLENATVPIIETGAGICHLYIDEKHNQEMAKNILINAKTQRNSVCNAIETLLINKKIPEDIYKKYFDELEKYDVEMFGDDEAKAKDSRIQAIESYKTEYLDAKISVKFVSDVKEATEHINENGTRHSEVIVTEDENSYKYFRNNVDAAVIYKNASSRFTDGFEFGLGAEIGISTQKMHARGPMGLKELTTYTYFVEGEGQVRG